MDNEIWTLVSNEPIAVYGAVLSTVIALGAGIKAIVVWATSGPKAWVSVINPLEVKATEGIGLDIIIANIGSKPFTVTEITLSSHLSKYGAAVSTEIFDHRSTYDPATKLIPNPNGQKNSQVRVAKVLLPGDEDHSYAGTQPTYDPHRHWLRVEVALRTKTRKITSWAPPINNDSSPSGWESKIQAIASTLRLRRS